MNIPKPIRNLCYMLIGLSLSTLCAWLLSKWLGIWGIFLGFLLYPMFTLFGGMPVDSLDFWLRRKTRDSLWLRTDEGKQWLNSEEGVAWQHNQRDRKLD